MRGTMRLLGLAYMAAAAHSLDNGLALTPPMGWCVYYTRVLPKFRCCAAALPQCAVRSAQQLAGACAGCSPAAPTAL